MLECDSVLTSALVLIVVCMLHSSLLRPLSCFARLTILTFFKTKIVFFHYFSIHMIILYPVIRIITKLVLKICTRLCSYIGTIIIPFHIWARRMRRWTDHRWHFPYMTHNVNVNENDPRLVSTFDLENFELRTVTTTNNRFVSRRSICRSLPTRGDTRRRKHKNSLPTKRQKETRIVLQRN